MSKDELNLRVVVNDEIIDLRNKNLDVKPVNRSLPYRTASQQAISSTTRSGLFSSVAERNKAKQNLCNGDILTNVNGLKRLATNMFFGPPLMRSNTKLRNRASSADPKFRQTLSPQTGLESKKPKSPSDPTFPIRNCQLQHQQQNRRAAAVKASANSTHESRNGFSRNSSNNTSFPRNIFGLESSEDKLKDDATKKGGRSSSGLKSSDDQNLSNETLPSTAEKSTMTEEFPSTTSFPECKNLHRTVSNSFRYGSKTTDIYKSMGDPCFEKPGQKSPYGNDPKLTEKYSKHLNPDQIWNSKRSWTIPLAIDGQGTPTVVQISPTETIDVRDNYTTCGNHSERIRTKIYNAMFKNYYLAVFFLMGSLCGLMLVAFFVWVFANDLLWAYLNQPPEPPKHTGLRWLLTYIGNSVLHIINFIFSKLYKVIEKPRHDLIDCRQNEGTWSIFW